MQPLGCITAQVSDFSLWGLGGRRRAGPGVMQRPQVPKWECEPVARTGAAWDRGWSGLLQVGAPSRGKPLILPDL